MSFNHYQTMQKRSIADPELLGTHLPQLHSADCVVSTERLQYSDLHARLSELKGAAGWAQYADKVMTFEAAQGEGEALPTAQLIEGEWYTGTRSVRVRLTGPDQYLLTEMTTHPDNEAQPTMVYRDLSVFCRTDLPVYKAVYRLWYRRNEAHQWLAHCQQFIGWCKEEVR
ncbi:hypothetical protein [Pseudoalteromonas rubra]|uniref:hypothetical protein n=1 Tax=Pseudoalteromonas rubra TaxID=43658 RepID=UPI000F7B60B8|nr:hypothetical protein [Pseudoalteromonas rubra]